MAYPVLENWGSATSGGVTVTSLDFTITGAVSGETLFIIVGSDDSTSDTQFSTTATGWVKENEIGSFAIDAHLAIFSRLADGSANDNVTVTIDAASSDEMSGIWGRISGGDHDTLDTRTSSAETASPWEGLTPTPADSGNYLIIAGMSMDGGDGGDITITSPFTILTRVFSGVGSQDNMTAFGTYGYTGDSAETYIFTTANNSDGAALGCLSIKESLTRAAVGDSDGVATVNGISSAIKGSVGSGVITYVNYFDGSDAIFDTGNFWTDDELAADGDIETFAYTSVEAAILGIDGIAGSDPGVGLNGERVDTIKVRFYFKATGTGVPLLNYKVIIASAEIANADLSNEGDAAWSDWVDLDPADFSSGWSDYISLRTSLSGIDDSGILTLIQIHKVEYEIILKGGNAAVEGVGGDGTDFTSEFYFDDSFVPWTDGDSVWEDEDNAFDGSISTYAYSTDIESGLDSEGTNAVDDGIYLTEITAVRSRIYGSADVGGHIRASISYDAVFLDYVYNYLDTGNEGWGTVATIEAPSGGWNWDNISELRAYITSQLEVGRIYQILLEVDRSPVYGAARGISNGVATVDGIGDSLNVATYYFDASIDGPNDPDSGWTDDTLAFNDTTTNYAWTGEWDEILSGTGHSGPSTGDNISQVRFRVYAEQISDYQNTTTVYDDTTLLGTIIFPEQSAQWSDWETLDEPAGGWDWNTLNNLEVIFNNDTPVGGTRIYTTELEVSTGGADDGTEPTTGNADGVATVGGESGATKRVEGSASGLAIAAGVAAALFLTEGDASAIATVDGQASVIVSSEGLSSGSASAGGVASAIALSEGLSDGLAAVDGQTNWTHRSEGLSEGLATIDGISGAEKRTEGLSEGVAVVDGIGADVGATILPSEGDAAGQAIVDGIAAALFLSEGLSEGLATVNGQSEWTHTVKGDAAGQAVVDGIASWLHLTEGGVVGEVTVDGISKAIKRVEGISTGAATVDGITSNIFASEGSSDGQATVDGIGSSRFDSVGDATGQATVDGISRAIKRTEGLSEGVAVVSGIGDDFNSDVTAAVGDSDGQAAVDGISGATKRTEGTSDGQSTVDGIGSSLFESVGDAAGQSTVDGISASLFESVGDAAGQATVDGIGSSRFDTVGDAAGQATVDGIGASLFESEGTSDGQATVDGISRAIKRTEGLSEGVAVVDGIGADQAGGEVATEGDAAGEATVDGISGATKRSEGLSEGIATVDGIGSSLFESVGNAVGKATVDGIASSIFTSEGSSVGQAAVDGISRAIKRTEGSSAGEAVVVGIGDDFNSDVTAVVGDSDGQAAVDGISMAIKQSEGASDGQATTDGIAGALSLTEGASDGQATVDGRSASLIESVGASSGQAAVDGRGAGVVESVGSSDGQATVDGISASIFAATGFAASDAVAIGLSKWIHSVVGNSAGTSVVSGVSWDVNSAEVTGRVCIEGLIITSIDLTGTIISEVSVDGIIIDQINLEGIIEDC